MTRPDTRELLLLTAERLFALEGVDAVSTRRIAQEAGQRNSSALQYHFGSKDQLIQELMALRMRSLNARRESLLAQLEAEGRLYEATSLVAAQAVPLLEQLRDPESHWVGCLHQLFSRAHGMERFAAADPALNSGVMKVSAGLESCMAHLPQVIRYQRLSLMGTQIVHVSADYYYQRERGEALPPLGDIASALVDFLVGGLLAPVTEGARQAVRSLA